jgi:hypothetical protein
MLDQYIDPFRNNVKQVLEDAMLKNRKRFYKNPSTPVPQGLLASPQTDAQSGLLAPEVQTLMPSVQSNVSTNPMLQKLGNVAQRIMETAQDDNSANAMFQALKPVITQSFPGMNGALPENVTLRDLQNIAQQAAVSYTQNAPAYRRYDPTNAGNFSNKYDPNPPARPGALDALQGLLAQDKGGSLKGALPLLIRSGLLGNGLGNGSGGGSPEDAVFVKPSAQQMGQSTDPIQGFMQSFQPTGDPETDAKMLKDYLDAQKSIKELNSPGAPQIISAGQTLVSPDGRVIANGGALPEEYGQPFPIIAKDGRQHMAVADKHGNIKLVDGFAPIPKTGASVSVNDGNGGSTDINLGGGDAAQGYPLAIDPPGTPQNPQSPNLPPPAIKDQMNSPARGGKGGIYYGKDGSVVSTATPGRTDQDQAVIAAMARIEPQLKTIMNYLPQFQTAPTRALSNIEGFANKYLGGNFFLPSADAMGNSAMAKTMEGLMNVYNLPKTDEALNTMRVALQPQEGESPKWYKYRVAKTLLELQEQHEQAKSRLKNGYQLSPAQNAQPQSNAGVRRYNPATNRIE